MNPMFKEVTGTERYTVTDLVTGGVRWDETKQEMLASVFYFTRVLGHSARVTDKLEPGNYVEYSIP